jgi:hypothetical protein
MSNMSLAEQLQAKLAAIDWAKDDTAHRRMEARTPTPIPAPKPSPFQVTNNLSRAAYEQVRDFPAARKNVSDALKARGYKIGSISAVLGQMIRQGVAQADDEGVLHVTTSEYVPLKASKTLRNMEKKAQKRKQIILNVRKRTVQVEEERPVSSSPAGAGLTALVPTPAPEGISRVDALLRSMSVLEARDLYDALKKIFGDNK